MVVSTSSCATINQTFDSTNSAELAFADTSSPSGIPGTFESLDGKGLKNFPLAIRVPSGTHVIGYSCPGMVSVDFQASTKASFISGRSYLLDCHANGLGTVRER
jgi:hypothetical protein